MTKAIAIRLVVRGFMTDYAPGEHGSFLRVVVNISTKRQTVERMVREGFKARKGMLEGVSYSRNP